MQEPVRDVRPVRTLQRHRRASVVVDVAVRQEHDHQRRLAIKRVGVSDDRGDRAVQVNHSVSASYGRNADCQEACNRMYRCAVEDGCIAYG